MLRIFLFLLLCNGAIAHAANTILVLGDSLSAGYGLPQSAGWVDLLQRRLAAEGHDYKVVNASISGETTLGGRNRIRSALTQHRPRIVVVALGGNDGLRGAPIASIRGNLEAIVSESVKSGSRVLLLGMQLPPNYGIDYVEKFRALYASIARSQRVALVPFMLEGFATDAAAFQADRIHPVAEVQPRILNLAWKELEPMLAPARARK